jgi:hypothetical protein
MSAIRFVELTMAPCAVVVAEGDAVKWALESLTFPGTIAKWCTRTRWPPASPPA